MNDILRQLKERKLVQWALAYVAAAFALIQVLDIVAQRFGWPAQAMRFAIIALSVGFFATLVPAWYHGERGAQRVSGTELLILALLLTIGGAVAWRLAPTAEPAAQIGATATRPAADADAPADRKSIAVLPFTDLSPGHDQEYFSDGMAEELLNALARVKDLKVAGRTSSFQFKGKGDDLRKIGKVLGVANILEGSVRKQGDKVRITAQLIRTDNDFHLWSETYDGDLSDVFALQERIARAITEQLKVVLEGEQKARLVPVATTSPEAYALYLQATAIFDRRDVLHYADGIAALEEAIRLDPNYARAYSRLAAMYVLLPTYTGTAALPAHQKLMQYAERASALDPTLAEPYAALGFSLGKFAGKGIEQRQAFERALELDADDVTTNFWYGLSLIKTGYRARGLALIDRSLTLDPMLPNGLRWRGIIYAYAGDLEHAGQLLRRARDVGLQFADRDLADVVQAQGDSAAAARLWLDGTRAMLPDLPPESYEVIANGIYGDASARTRAVALIETYLEAHREHIPGIMPLNLFKLGEPARALTAFHHKLTGDTTDFLVLLWSPKGRPLRALPEFPAFLSDFGFVALWDKYGAPDVCARKAPGDYACE